MPRILEAGTTWSVRGRFLVVFGVGEEEAEGLG